MSIEEARKLPPTVIITSEFDLFRRDAYDFVEKLRNANRLADFADYGEVGHLWQTLLGQDNPMV